MPLPRCTLAAIASIALSSTAFASVLPAGGDSTGTFSAYSDAGPGWHRPGPRDGYAANGSDGGICGATGTFVGWRQSDQSALACDVICVNATKTPASWQVACGPQAAGLPWTIAAAYSTDVTTGLDEPWRVAVAPDIDPSPAPRDNLSLVALPEPASLALILVGVLGVSAVRARRARRSKPRPSSRPRAIS
jgi:hypothetical protein